MTLKECIEEILDKNFKSEDYFDSHTIINLILQKPDYYFAYLQEYHNNYQNCDVAQFHGQIAKNMIQSLKGKVKSSKISVISLNAFRTLSENALWQKI